MDDDVFVQFLSSNVYIYSYIITIKHQYYLFRLQGSLAMKALRQH